MPSRERAKGLRGEREVATIFQTAGGQVRNLEGTGDHLIVFAPIVGPALETDTIRHGITLHIECKRQEIARPWAWLAQAEAEAPSGTVPVVAFRRNHGRWYAMLPLEQLAEILA